MQLTNCFNQIETININTMNTIQMYIGKIERKMQIANIYVLERKKKGATFAMCSGRWKIANVKLSKHDRTVTENYLH